MPKSLQVSKIFPIFAPKIEDNMEQQTDIRWIQRYANFHKACTRLLDVTEADRFMDDPPLLKQLDESLAKLSQDQNYQQV